MKVKAGYNLYDDVNEYNLKLLEQSWITVVRTIIGLLIIHSTFRNSMNDLKWYFISPARLHYWIIERMVITLWLVLMSLNCNYTPIYMICHAAFCNISWCLFQIIDIQSEECVTSIKLFSGHISL